MNTRTLIAIIIALLAGLVLGRLGPQADLRRLRADLEEARKGGGDRKAVAAGAAMQGVRSMLNVSAQDLEQARAARRNRSQLTNEAAAVTGATETAVASTNRPGPRGPPGARRDRAAVSNEIEKLKEAWSMRADLARTSFIKRAKLDERQATDFAVLMEAMNYRLGATVDKWVEAARTQGKLTPESGVRMMNDLSQALVVTYDEMDRKLPETWRENAGDNFELVRFVDPEVLTPLQDLEGLVQTPPDLEEEPKAGVQVGVQVSP